MNLSPFDPDAFAPIAALLAQELPAPASAPTTSQPVGDLHLTPAEASRMLPPGDVIHVVGVERDRWSPQRVRELLRTAIRIRLALAGRIAGFGLSVDRRGAESILVETDRDAVDAWLARQAERLVRE